MLMRGPAAVGPLAADGARYLSGDNRSGALGPPPPSHSTEQSHDGHPMGGSIGRTRQVSVTYLDYGAEPMICGVDVAKQTLEARMGQDGPIIHLPNTPTGIAQLADFCRRQGSQMVAMEASGGYERKPFSLLWAEGIPVALLNPRGVRYFAEGMGVLEKTDRIDCGVIAWFAATKKCVPTPLPTAQQEQLKALVTRLRQLTELRAMERNQRLLVTEPEVLRSTKALLALLDKQIGTLEGRIAELIAADPLWRQLDTAFRSIKGVADRTVARLMAEMPEIGILSNKKVSKLAGLAPLARDSGNSQGKRVVRGGRRSIRDILYFVSGVVARYNPDFLAFRERLTLAGKPKKVIRVALAHKLLVRLNAKAREVRRHYATTTAGVMTGA